MRMGDTNEQIIYFYYKNILGPILFILIKYKGH